MLVTEAKARTVAEKKFSGDRCISATVCYAPYWVSCYRFNIPRIFMKSRPLDIWIACDAQTGRTFPIRIDGDVFEDRELEESSLMSKPLLEPEKALEAGRTAAYEAFVKRYLAMRDPVVKLSFNKLVFFPMWAVIMESRGGSCTEVVMNGRSGGIEKKNSISGDPDKYKGELL